MDVALFSQALHHAEHPQAALTSAYKILRLGGRLIILDLMEHQFEQARKLYGDRWLGFPKNTLHQWITEAGFKQAEITEAAREEEPPHFTTLVAVTEK